jgi:indole-3-glycerol phosphate synthase
VLVSESGIRTAEDLARIRACGVDAVLIGEALMRGESGLVGEINAINEKAERPTSN